MYYDSERVAQLIRDNTANPANNYRNDVRSAYARMLTNAVADINNCYTRTQDNVAKATGHPFAYDLVSQINTFLLEHYPSQFEQVFQLTGPNHEEKIASLVTRYKNATEMLGRGLTQTQIEENVTNGGFNSMAVELESEVNAFLNKLCRSKTSAPSGEYIEHGIELYRDNDYKPENEAQYYRALTVWFSDIIEILLEPYATTTSSDHSSQVKEACRMAFQYYTAAHRQLSFMKSTFCHKLYSVSPALFNELVEENNANITYKDFHIAARVIERTNMAVTIHSESGLFSLGTYLRFFAHHMVANPHTATRSDLSDKTLLPYDYVLSESLKVHKKYKPEHQIPSDKARDMLLAMIELWCPIRPSDFS